MTTKDSAKKITALAPGIYKHYKGKLYKVIGVAHHSETLDEMVVYQAMYESAVFGKDALMVRPIESFLENVDVNGKKVKRFEKVA